MIASKRRLILLVSCVSVLMMSSRSCFHVTAQTTTTNSNSSGVDEDLVDRPDTNIDFDGCANDLYRTDRNGDGGVDQDEFLNFVQEYGKRICFETDALTLQQRSVFIHLACRCAIRDDNTVENCCFGDDAKIDTAGASIPKAQRTSSEQDYLVTVCKLTDATISAKCPPTVEDRDDPDVVVAQPPGSIVTVSSPPPAADDDGLGWKWALIAAAILIFLLCFCCVFRRRRGKQLEEEQEDEVIATTTDKGEEQPRAVETDMEQAKVGVPPGSDPRSMMVPDAPTPGEDFLNSPEEEPDIHHPANVEPMMATSVATGMVVGPDDDDDEETRRKKGGGRIPDDNDPDKVIYSGAPPFPPPENPPPPPHQLKPIPDKEHETDDWDQPGRDIQYPIEKDEMSAGEVEHYEPDGGVYFPGRPPKNPVSWNREWNRAKPEDPDEVDARKHRIQTGLGEGEVWNKLDEESGHFQKPANTGGDAFDWVIQSALGALGDTNTTSSSKKNKNDDDDDDDFA